MINTYTKAFNTDKGLTTISAHQASELISKYNIYFRAVSAGDQEYIPTHALDYSIYQLDNLKNFDKQYQQIKSINFPNRSTISFYTDHKENEMIVKHRVELAHQETTA